VAAALRTRDAGETARLLQANGIAASVVADASDLLNDDHLWERGYFATVRRDFRRKRILRPPRPRMGPRTLRTSSGVSPGGCRYG
jgi:crotonobetainyl-CoA:carnitine CoA-transferase CaiB-like acyl-CoA transferase